MKKTLFILMGICMIILLGGCKEKPKENTDTPNVKKEYKVDEQGIILSEDAKEIIEQDATKVIEAISQKDFNTLSSYVHPVLGLSFSPYTYIAADNTMVLPKEEVAPFFEDDQTHLWGIYDGSGEDIQLTKTAYYEEFIYPVDYKNAERISYNEPLSSGNMIANEHEVYEKAIVVEYYFSGFQEEYEGADWKSLKLIFIEYEGEFKLVHIVQNQWTV